MFWQCSNVPLFSRCLFLPVHAEAEAALAHHEAQHHLPDVRLPPGLRRLVLPQRRHVLHRQDRPVYSLQLRVSIQGPSDQLSFALKLKTCEALLDTTIKCRVNDMVSTIDQHRETLYNDKNLICTHRRGRTSHTVRPSVYIYISKTNQSLLNLESHSES